MSEASAAAISETARERETYRYDALAISTAGLRGQRPTKAIPSAVLSSTPDPGLTAFAQLAVYKLHASRALVSLFDRSYQHIVAEALRPLARGPDGAPLPGAEDSRVWFNGLTFPRTTSVCEHVVTGDATSQSVPGTALGLAAEDIPVSIIRSMNVDARFCHINDPSRQFYSGVPIRSPRGINIGVFCIFDDKPRPDGLDAEDVRFMRDMSKIIMDYLENKQSHEWYRREERMVRGLGGFVEGHATLADSMSSTSDVPASLRDVPGTKEGAINNKLPITVGAQGIDREPDTKLPKSTQQKHTAASGHHHTTSGGKGAADFRPVVGSAMASPSATIQNRSPTKAQSHTTARDRVRADVERVFSKAANVIRESIEVEGVLFLDASVQSYGGLVGHKQPEPSILASPRHMTSESSSSDENKIYNERARRRESPVDDHASCGVLGFATSHSSSIAGEAAPAEFTSTRERFLQRLLRRYPHGGIFNFEADGSISDHASSSSDGDDGRPSGTKAAAAPPSNPTDTSSDMAVSKLRNRLSAAGTVVKMFPGARSVVIIPLWDPQRDRWFAGGFVWTRTATRIFTRQNEVSYLRAFGLAVMAEVGRLKTRAADKAKTDILGSISHELRSPLHGMVGAVELLRNTRLDGFQESIVRTIETSGRTLLDTIDHLLDYSQMVNKGRSSRAGPKGNMSGVEMPKSSPSTTLGQPDVPVRMDSLVEEVVESVLAGSSYRLMFDTHSPSSLVSPSSSSTSSLHRRHHKDDQLSNSHSNVQICLDIDYTANWSFMAHPGAMRRIVMNLFGNSLKFTRSGFIRVSLRQEAHPKRPTSSGTTVVVLSVADSGRGIGEDYLRNHLFTPFAQEDSFAPGTGLGLSLVRQMTATMGGTVDILSLVGEGTMAIVSLPLPQATAQQTSPDEDEARFRESVEKLAGLRVQLRGFEPDVRMRKGFEQNDAHQRSQLQLMEDICQDCLQMKITVAGDAPDVVICNAADSSTRLTPSTVKELDKYPHLFVCRDTLSAHALAKPASGSAPKLFEVLPQPVSPRKLARMLCDGLSRWQDTQALGKQPAAGSASTERANPDQSSEQPNSKSSTLEENLPLRPRPEQDVRAENTHENDSSTAAKSITPLEQPLLQQPTTSGVAQRGAVGAIATALDPRASILIVDDNAINLKILSAYMGKLKHPHTTAVNGLEAVELYATSPEQYSCVLTDISMPVMDGLEATRQIRALERTRGLKPTVIIALTGLGGADVRQDAVASGVDLFLTRPLMFKGLQEALSTTGLR